MKIKGLMLPVLFFLCSHAAVADCTKPTNSYDRTYCTAKLFMESDKELNDVYKELTALVKPNLKKKIVSVQLSWLKFRNNACEALGSINVDCNYKVNKERTEFWRDRLRECKTGHCREDLMLKDTWIAPVS